VEPKMMVAQGRINMQFTSLEPCTRQFS
jgi:hypothetical protein